MFQAKSRGNRAQHIVGFELGGNKLRRDHIFMLKLFEQIAHQHGFARADFAGDDDEAFAQGQTIFEISHGALVALATEEKLRVGIKRERFSAQMIKRFVHRRSL